jgi:xanthine dehydrogenase YagS FAD-binding subunit
MHPFEYARVTTIPKAIESGGRFIAGGTNLVDLMKTTVERPARVVDINALPLSTIEDVQGGIRIGALARMADVAAHPLVERRFPAISQALLASASPQLRNAASIGGNLMQRTRCPYFRELVWTPCNKRDPGSGCAAIDGYTRYHAILGASPHCVAVHPSDMAVAMAALDAAVLVLGVEDEHAIPVTELYRLPRDDPPRDTVLEHGDLITEVYLPPLPFAHNSTYRKVRDRASYAFALVSVAAALDVADGMVRDVRIALGGVAHKPWRAARAEQLLRGQPATEDAFRAAAEAELADAQPLRDNAVKVPMAIRTIVATLRELAS